MEISNIQSGHEMPQRFGSKKYELAKKNAARIEKIGDSFVITLVEGDKKTTQASVQTALNKNYKITGRSYLAREIPGLKGKIRVWLAKKK